MKAFAVTIAMLAVSATLEPATAETGTAPFCLQTSTGARCVFSTMGDCESARGSGGSTAPGQCMTRTDALGTTGLGTERAPPSYRSGEQPPAGPYFPTR